jgi:putative FmdB family regulatory protein
LLQALALYDALKLSFMPIYAYKCDACGYAKDVLQKMSDPQLTDCPSCGQASFKKQLTAAGFQLKGTGWYVTDFREGAGKNSAPAVDAKSDSGDSAAKAPADSKTAQNGSTAATPAASTTASAPAAPKAVTAAPSSPAPSAASGV